MTIERFMRWTVLATAVLTCIWFSPSLLDPFNIPKLVILLVGASALLGLMLFTVRGWFKPSEWPMWGSVLLFVLGISASAIASDQSGYRTLWGAWARNNGWLAYVSLAVLLLAVAITFRGKDAKWGLFGLVSAGYVQVFYAIFQTTGNDPIRWNNAYNPILGTVGNPNFASALLGTAAVAMVSIAFDSRRISAYRWLNAAIATLAVWLTVRSESIQGTLAFGAGFAVLLAAWISQEERSIWLRRLLWPYVGFGVVGAGVGIWGLTGGGPLANILFSQNLLNRTYYWRAGWNMFKSDPLFGVGLDSYGDYYRLLRIQEQVDVTGAGVVSNAAHSVVFQMLGTGGLLFFGTYLVLQLVALQRALSTIREGEDRLLVGALLACWMAFTLQSLFSIDQLGLTVWGWVITGLLFAISYPKSPDANRGKNPRRRSTQVSSSTFGLAVVSAMLLAAVSVGFALRPLSFESNLRLALTYGYDQSNPNPTAQAEIRDAVLAAVDDAPDPYWRAVAIQKLLQVGANDAALQLAEKSARAFPMDSSLWNLVATTYEQTGRPKEAVEWRERSVYLDPLNTELQSLLKQDQAASES